MKTNQREMDFISGYTSSKQRSSVLYPRITYVLKFFPLFVVKEDTFNVMVATHSKTLMIYQNITLMWAAQLPHIPVDAKVANFGYVCLQESSCTGVFIVLNNM